MPIGNFQSAKIQPNSEYEVLTSFAYGVAADDDSIYALSVGSGNNRD